MVEPPAGDQAIEFDMARGSWVACGQLPDLDAEDSSGLVITAALPNQPAHASLGHDSGPGFQRGCLQTGEQSSARLAFGNRTMAAWCWRVNASEGWHHLVARVIEKDSVGWIGGFLLGQAGAETDSLSLEPMQVGNTLVAEGLERGLSLIHI